MILVEQTTVPAEALPVAEFRDHLRLGSGFADDGLQDTVLDTCLRAAMAAIEARTGKAILQRRFSWTLTAWRDLARQALPVAPVTAISALRQVDRFGAETIVAPERYRLERDTHKPALVATSFLLPSVPLGGHVEIEFDAGYGAEWAAVPADLARAVLLLAAHYYENRTVAGEGGEIPFGVSSLLQPYRTVRLFGGGLRR